MLLIYWSVIILAPVIANEKSKYFETNIIIPKEKPKNRFFTTNVKFVN